MHMLRSLKDSNVKLAVLFLHLVYLVLGFSLVGCVVWHHDQTILTTYPPALAIAICGGLLGILALAGLVFTVMGNKRLLLLYHGAMCILVVLLGALGGICLGANSSSVTSLLVRGWINADSDMLDNVQTTFQCCGFQNPMGIGHPPCHPLVCCLSEPEAACCTGENVTSAVECPCKTACGHLLETHGSHSVKVVGATSLILGLIVLFGTMFLIIQQLQEHHQQRIDAEQNNEETEDSSATARYQRF